MLAMLKERVGHLAGKRIVVLGIAFKPGTDDVRESPALTIIDALVREGAQVVAHDPIAIETGRKGLADFGVDLDRVRLEPDLATALADADAVMLVTSWPQYREAPAMMNQASSAAPLIDGRRLIDRHAVPAYSGIGLSVTY
jgi:UDPglucose 6-dehydrogenase/GDP-mannose 6-dehydrogenase